MPCLKAPALPIPTLPAGVTIPLFTPPILPNLGFCCKIQTPAQLQALFNKIPSVALVVAFPPAVVTTLNQLIAGIQSYYDQLQVSCPLE